MDSRQNILNYLAKPDSGQKSDCGLLSYFTIGELMRDIRNTQDPIRKTILNKFIAIKVREVRIINKDPSLDGLSDDMSIDDILNKSTQNTDVSDIIKKQNESLLELDKLHKMRVYTELINDNKKDIDLNNIEKRRGGDTERMWGSTYDPRYIKYAKEDTMNNKVMERLNSEIDFRNEDEKRDQIEKPFNDGDCDVTEPFAHYETSADEKKKYVPKNKQPNKNGQKKTFYHSSR